MLQLTNYVIYGWPQKNKIGFWISCLCFLSFGWDIRELRINENGTIDDGNVFQLYGIVTKYTKNNHVSCPFHLLHTTHVNYLRHICMIILLLN